MKNNALPVLLSLAFLMLAPTVSFAAKKYARLSGAVYLDTNGNNSRDTAERGRAPSIIWLYRVLPNGAVQRVRQVYTNTAGGYSIPRVVYGTYFLSIYNLTGGGTPIRTANFTVNVPGLRRNLPLVTSATLLSNPLYAAAYTGVTNPQKLTKGPDPTTPYTPGP